MKHVLTSFLACLFALSCAAQNQQTPFPEIKHIVVIGVDGLSPDGIEQAKTPYLDKLREEGAWTYQTNAVLPTSSSPNWASIIMGAGPEQHGIHSNAWKPDDHVHEPICAGEDGTFPTIFALHHQQYPKAKQFVVHQWLYFGSRLVERGVVNRKLWTATASLTAGTASHLIRRMKPRLGFVHLDLVDHAGHKFGHGTAEYYASVERADEHIGRMIRALDRSGIRKHTLLIVTSDHGGIGHGHGGDSPEEVNVPWIANGPGVKPGKLPNGFMTYDTGATLAWLLGVETPECWIGQPVRAAFQ